jgi:hypothetical protein
MSLAQTESGIDVSLPGMNRPSGLFGVGLQRLVRVHYVWVIHPQQQR